MVLAESDGEQMTFRFRGGRWGLFTLVPGAGFVAWGAWLLGTHSRWRAEAAILGAFGVLFVYSSIYSLTAHQSLVVDGRTRTIRFRKKNLYGSTDWERGADGFKRIRVFRPAASRGGRAMNWSIVLEGADARDLFIGENELGSLHHDHALEMARQVGTFVGIPVEDDAG